MNDVIRKFAAPYWDSPAEKRVVVGIDPGFSGGIAIINLNGTVVGGHAMPTIKVPKGNELDLTGVMRILGTVDPGDIAMVVIEKVSARPTDGVIGAFRFGLGYGQLIAIFRLFGLPFQRPTPQAWQKVILAGNGNENKDKKAVAIEFVKSRWPKLSLLANERCKKDHDGIADAVCIAEWGRRQLVGNIEQATSKKKRKKPKPIED